MNTFAKILVLGFAVAVAAPVASATPFSGFGISGQDNDAFANFPSEGSVTFGLTDEYVSTTGTGYFSGVTSATTLNFVSNFAFYAIPPTGLELFSFTAGANNFVFDVTSVVVSGARITFNGLLEENGGVNSFPAYMTMQNTNGALNQNLNLAPFDGFFGLIPEPSSLTLMGTGLIAMAMLFRKRRTA